MLNAEPRSQVKEQQRSESVKGSALDGAMTLVGVSGGLSMIYDTRMGSLVAGLLTVETEHGMLLLDPDEEYHVLSNVSGPQWST